MFELYEELNNIQKHCENCEKHHKQYIEQLKYEIEMYKRFWIETQQRLNGLRKAIESENFAVEFVEENKQFENKKTNKEKSVRIFKCKLTKNK